MEYTFNYKIKPKDVNLLNLETLGLSETTQTTGRWWRDTQISTKRLAVQFPAVKSPLYFIETYHVVNCLQCFGAGMSAFCLPKQQKTLGF